MSMTGAHALDTSIHKTNDWLGEIARQLEISDRNRALQALRASLQALRDRLTVEQSAHLAAQLPVVIRGLYFEGWRPASMPARVRSREDFLEMIRSHLDNDELASRAEEVARATFAVLTRHVSSGEAEKVAHSLPEPIRELWRAA